MKGFFNLFNKGAAYFVAAAAIVSLAPSSGYAGLLGTTAGGTLNVGLSSTNYFDLSAVPGSAPVNATVVDPGVEFTSNAHALQTAIPGLTTFMSADIADHQILLTWINAGINPNLIPATKFTFNLSPTGGQKISNVTFDFGLPGAVTFSAHQVQIAYGPFLLGSASSAFGHYSLSFVNVPEPATYLLLSSMALIALFAARRREAHQIC